MSVASVRYPSNITQDFNTYIQISRHTFEGYTEENVFDPKNFQYKESLAEIMALPVPNNISDATSTEYSSIDDFNLVRNALSTVTNMIPDSWGKNVTARTGAMINRQPATIFDGVSLKSHTFQWELIPNNSREAKDIEYIIDAFKMGMLPKEDGHKLLLPDIWKVTVKGADSLFKYIPMFVTNVEVNGAPTGHFQTYSDGMLPVYSFSVSFVEITNRTQQIESSLGNRTPLSGGFNG